MLLNLMNFHSICCMQECPAAFASPASTGKQAWQLQPGVSFFLVYGHFPSRSELEPYLYQSSICPGPRAGRWRAVVLVASSGHHVCTNKLQKVGDSYKP